MILKEIQQSVRDMLFTSISLPALFVTLLFL